MRNMRICALVLSLLVAGLCHPAFAQDASIVGTVADESKAVLPGVTVTATSLETGGQSIAVTDERGEYRLPKLPPGKYKLQAELRGLRARSSFRRVELLVGQNATVPFTLKVAHGQRDADGHRRDAARRHHRRRRSPATSIAGRWRSCRCRAATGWSCR